MQTTAARGTPGTAPKGCYKCGQSGHWARDCTVPQSQWIPRQPPPGGWPQGRTPGAGAARRETGAAPADVAAEGTENDPVNPEGEQQPLQTAAAARKEKRKRPKLTLEVLQSSKGIPDVMTNFPDAFRRQFKGKGHEASDLRRLLEMYKRWQDRMWPHSDFDPFICNLERLSGTNLLKHHMRELRVGLLKEVQDIADPPHVQLDAPAGSDGRRQEEEEMEIELLEDPGAPVGPAPGGPGAAGAAGAAGGEDEEMLELLDFEELGGGEAQAQQPGAAAAAGASAGGEAGQEEEEEEIELLDFDGMEEAAMVGQQQQQQQQGQAAVPAELAQQAPASTAAAAGGAVVTEEERRLLALAADSSRRETAAPSQSVLPSSSIRGGSAVAGGSAAGAGRARELSDWERAELLAVLEELEAEGDEADKWEQGPPRQHQQQEPLQEASPELAAYPATAAGASRPDEGAAEAGEAGGSQATEAGAGLAAGKAMEASVELGLAPQTAAGDGAADDGAELEASAEPAAVVEPSPQLAAVPETEANEPLESSIADPTAAADDVPASGMQLGTVSEASEGQVAGGGEPSQEL